MGAQGGFFWMCDDYRFGFNGKENDKDWGTQLIQDYGFRLYNPAIAKFLSFDPLAPDYPELTPYQFASNTPIQAIDLDGLEAEFHYNLTVGNDGKTKVALFESKYGDLGVTGVAPKHIVHYKWREYVVAGWIAVPEDHIEVRPFATEEEALAATPGDLQNWDKDYWDMAWADFWAGFGSECITCTRSRSKSPSSSAPKLLEPGKTATHHRNSPGYAYGKGKKTEGTWLKGTSGNAGYVPEEVANGLRGRSFKNFDEYREAFWKEVSKHPHLLSQFSASNQTLMKKGNAPFAVGTEKTGTSSPNQRVYNLHHIKPIENGGSVYDADNIMIVTPIFHKGLHDK